MGCQLHLTAIADVVMVRLHCDTRNLFGDHLHAGRVGATAGSLCGNKVVGHIPGDGVCGRVAPFRSSVDRCPFARLALVPLVGQAANVRNVDRRGQGHLTVVANRDNGVKECHNHRLVHIHFKRVARRGAAASSVRHKHNVCEGRVAALGARIGLPVIYVHVVRSPCVLVGHILYAVVQVRNKSDIVFTLAHILRAADRNRRHRSNENCIKFH